MKVNLFLLTLVLMLSFFLVNIRYESRLINQEIEAQTKVYQDLEVELGQLKLEESTLSTHSRVEKIAVEQLKMKDPTDEDIILILE